MLPDVTVAWQAGLLAIVLAGALRVLLAWRLVLPPVGRLRGGAVTRAAIEVDGVSKRFRSTGSGRAA